MKKYSKPVWKKWPGNRKYSVSIFGHVMRNAGGPGAVPGRILNPHLSNGYPAVNVMKNGKIRRCLVHELVADTHLGLRRNKEDRVTHLDGNKINCRADNLKYATHSEVMKNATKLGNVIPPRLFGEDNKAAKLTATEVQFIRFLGKKKLPLDDIHGLFDKVGKKQIKDILEGNYWSSVKSI